MNAAYFIIGAAGGAVLLSSQYVANFYANSKFMTAIFLCAFGMSSFIFQFMLIGTY